MPAANEVQNLSLAAVELLVTVGLFASVISQYPESVQEAFIEKVELFTQRIRDEQQEFIDFGESYDEEDDSPEAV